MKRNFGKENMEPQQPNEESDEVHYGGQAHYEDGADTSERNARRGDADTALSNAYDGNGQQPRSYEMQAADQQGQHRAPDPDAGGAHGNATGGANQRRYTLSAAPGEATEMPSGSVRQHSMAMGPGDMGNISQRGYRDMGASPAGGHLHPGMVQHSLVYEQQSLSPTHLAHRMSMSFYPSQSPNFAQMDATMGDLSFRGGSMTGSMNANANNNGVQLGVAPGTASQAEREEELLLNLLITRRQRSRMGGGASGKGGANLSLADELMRLRQNGGQPGVTPGMHQQGSVSNNALPRAQSSSSNLPPGPPPGLPGMPPLYQEQMQGGGGVPPNAYPSSDYRGMPHHQGHMMKEYPSYHPHQHSHPAMRHPDLSERIDRSPGRFQMMDARMGDFSDRGMMGGYKRAYGSMGMGMHPMPYEGMAYGAPQSNEAMDGPPTKKKRAHKKKPADMPRRPLSAYNLFFSEERERILKEIEKKDGKSESSIAVDDDATAPDDGSDTKAEDSDEKDSKEKPKALLRPLIPAQKKRRPHRKTHGKISFQQLARMVGERWKSLPEKDRKYYQDLAQEDMKRQKIAMEEYYAKQNASKTPQVKTEPSNAQNTVSTML